MHIIMKDGRKFSGTPVQIVQGMRSVAFDKQDASLVEYAAWVVDNVARNDEQSIKLTGSSEEEICSSLVSELVRTGLAK